MAPRLCRKQTKFRNLSHNEPNHPRAYLRVLHDFPILVLHCYM
uniref:Uncharacterized protein n=1 Tax=Rhizophora mucronata TaxID=61149 RepID=A0A2P2NUW2_RHIMU